MKTLKKRSNSYACPKCGSLAVRPIQSDKDSYVCLTCQLDLFPGVVTLADIHGKGSPVEARA